MLDAKPGVKAMKLLNNKHETRCRGNTEEIHKKTSQLHKGINSMGKQATMNQSKNGG